MPKPLNLFTLPDASVFYRDLRQQQDDKTILENPHKGWYVHYIISRRCAMCGRPMPASTAS